MGGRGRGRGSGISLNTEFLGLNKGDLPPAAVSPPPLFPLLQNKPIPIDKGEREEKLLAYQQQLVEQIADSQQDILANYNKTILPKELKVGARKRGKPKQPNLKKKSRSNIEERLNNLEANEKHDDDSGDDEEKKVDSDDEEKKNEEDEDQIEEDEEMDGGTDYANNYFDNGEGYDDDDDNIDEGGVY